MKNTLVKLAILTVSLFSASAFANKLVITGEPLALEKRGETYIVPETYNSALPYQYVTVEGQQRACFLDKRPDFGSLDVQSLNVQIGSQTATWNCYTTDPTYFTVE